LFIGSFVESCSVRRQDADAASPSLSSYLNRRTSQNNLALRRDRGTGGRFARAGGQARWRGLGHAAGGDSPPQEASRVGTEADPYKDVLSPARRDAGEKSAWQGGACLPTLAPLLTVLATLLAPSCAVVYNP
jgi:hypothetical protein